MKKNLPLCFIIFSLLSFIYPLCSSAQNAQETLASSSEATDNSKNTVDDKKTAPAQGPIWLDDAFTLESFAKRYSEYPKATLLAMINDETLNDIKVAAAVRAFRQVYGQNIFAQEKANAIRILLRRLNRSDSAFVQVEVLHALCLMDRYKYYDAYVPKIILKMDHYNSAVSNAAYAAMKEIISEGNNRPREARVVFNMLRKLFFLSRKRLAKIDNPDKRLSQKLDILRWSIKVLGRQYIKRLPNEVLNLL